MNEKTVMERRLLGLTVRVEQARAVNIAALTPPINMPRARRSLAEFQQLTAARDALAAEYALSVAAGRRVHHQRKAGTR